MHELSGLCLLRIAPKSYMTHMVNGGVFQKRATVYVEGLSCAAYIDGHSYDADDSLLPAHLALERVTASKVS